MLTSSYPITSSGRYPDAVALRAAMDNDEISARSALESCFNVIDACNGEINAIVYEDRRGAREMADACDRAASPIGPLHGTPVTIKESFDWAGHPTTWGDPERTGQIAEIDSDVVTRLRRAGAVIIGKTNIPPYLSDWETANPLYGVTRNPNDITRSAGGSSGGSAAAVASGMSYIDVGSDQGGSIRYPAHNCGVHGFKPSWGRVPMGGHSPLGERRMPDIAAAGPLTRSARDASLALDALFGAEERSIPRPVEEVKFAQLPPLSGCPIDTAYQQAIDAFCDRLKDAGAHLHVAKPDIDFDRATELMNLLVRAETVRKTELVARFRDRMGADPSAQNAFTQINDKGARISHHEWLILHEERLAMCEAISGFFETHDILLCPAAAGPAAPLRLGTDATSRTVPVNGREEPILQQHMLHMPGSLLYLPAHVAPIDQCSNGLPMGIQMIGPLGQDRHLLAVAEELERKRTLLRESIGL